MTMSCLIRHFVKSLEIIDDENRDDMTRSISFMEQQADAMVIRRGKGAIVKSFAYNAARYLAAQYFRMPQFMKRPTARGIGLEELPC